MKSNNRLNIRNVIEIIVVAIFSFALILLRKYLNPYGNLLMVWITVLYVIATVEICLANMNAVKATREQLAESKRQYEETRRLNSMPYLQVNISPGKLINEEEPQMPNSTFAITNFTLDNCVNTVYCIALKNVGLGLLHRTQIIWDSECRHNEEHPERDLIIPPQVEWKIAGLFTGEKAKYDDSSTWKVTDAQLTIIYEDLLGNRYYQKVKFVFMISNADIEITDYYITCPSIYESKEAPHA